MTKNRRRSAERDIVSSSSEDGNSSSESLGIEESKSSANDNQENSNTLTVIQEQLIMEDLKSSNSFNSKTSDYNSDSLYSSDPAGSSREINLRQSEEIKEVSDNAKSEKIRKSENKK